MLCYYRNTVSNNEYFEAIFTSEDIVLYSWWPSYGTFQPYSWQLQVREQMHSFLLASLCFVWVVFSVYILEISGVVSYGSISRTRPSSLWFSKFPEGRRLVDILVGTPDSLTTFLARCREALLTDPLPFSPWPLFCAC